MTKSATARIKRGLAGWHRDGLHLGPKSGPWPHLLRIQDQAGREEVLQESLEEVARHTGMGADHRDTYSHDVDQRSAGKVRTDSEKRLNEEKRISSPWRPSMNSARSD